MDLKEKMPVSIDFFSGHMDTKEEKWTSASDAASTLRARRLMTEQDGALAGEGQNELDTDI